MSIQEENVIPFIVDIKDVPLEAELAYIVGIVGDKIKKGGFFRRSKERLTQVSKFYWRLHLDTINNRLVLVDSMGIYGGGAGVQDLALANVISQFKAIFDATTPKAYSDNLEYANRALILNTHYYSLFDGDFTKSLFSLIKKTIGQDMIDAPLILPSFEETVSNEIIEFLNEIPHFTELKDQLEAMARQWLAEVNSEIDEIERTFAGKQKRLQDDVNRRIERYKETKNHKIDTALEKANKAIFEELSRFESSTLGLTGLITPIQEHARRILNDVPSVETPKFHDSMKSFLSKSKGQIETISSKVKSLESDRRHLAKTLDSITKEFLDKKKKANDEYTYKKENAEKEVENLRMNRDKSLSDLVNMRDSIKENTEELGRKLDSVVKNRKNLISKAVVSTSGSTPADIIISLYLIKFQEKADIRYFVIPPLIKTRKGKNTDYPNPQMDSAIIGGKQVADKIAEELVFNRRLRSSFNALKATNYLATDEFKGAVKQGLNFLIQNKHISKKTHKRITDLLDDLEL